MKPMLHIILTTLLLAPLAALHAAMLHLFRIDYTRLTSRLRRTAFSGRPKTKDLLGALERVFYKNYGLARQRLPVTLLSLMQIEL
jgi:hypothetical protein